MMFNLNAEAFRRIGASEKVIDWLNHGVTFPFKKGHPPRCYHYNRIKNDREFSFVTDQVKKLEIQGCVKEVASLPHCTLALSCVPKKNGKLQLVLDCRPLNDCIECPSFSQEGIKGVSALIQENDQLVTFDIESGFHHIPVHKDFQTYISFEWQGRYYVWTCLAFGINIAPYYFHKVVRPMVIFLRDNNIRISPFVDDFLLMAQAMCMTDHKEFTLNTFDDLGW